MNIVVVNDDGINSEGLMELAFVLKQLGKVTVVAPNSQKSGAGHSITCHSLIKFEKIKYSEDIDGYVVYGTPRDCTDLARNYIFRNENIDLLVSGINYGCNVASDIICSGTCGAASTGINYGIPCIATSLDFGEDYDFKLAASIILKIVQWYLKNNFKDGSCLNINIPNLPKEEIKGIKVCGYGGNLVYNIDPKIEFDGQFYYLSNQIENIINEGKPDFNNDYYTLREGYITLTPLDLDLVKYDYIDDMKKAISDLDF